MKRNNKGITLMALVITIIVLIILAGISIQTIKNIQLFEKSKIAKEEDKKAQIKEYLNLKLVGKQAASYDKGKTAIIENTRKEVKEEELKKYGKDIEIKNIEKNNEEVYFYVIIDNEAYKVSLKGAEYIGKRNTEDIQLSKGDIEFIYNPTDWTNGKVKVEIKANKNIDGYSLEYKTKDNNTWTKYIKELEVDKNQDIYARLSGVLGQTAVATGTIANIDRLKPKDFTPKVTATTNSITVESNTTDQEKTSDDECSGIAGYRFSKNNGVNWTDWQISGSYIFEDMLKDINGSKYIIAVQAKDKAENITTSTLIQTETTKNMDYYINIENKLLCQVCRNDGTFSREYYKYNNEGAIAAVVYSQGKGVANSDIGLEEKIWMYPLLVSTNKNAVSYYCGEMNDKTNVSGIMTSDGQIVYKNVTYYYSSSAWWFSIEDGSSYISAIKELNLITKPYNNNLNLSESLKASALDLIKKYLEE